MASSRVRPSPLTWLFPLLTAVQFCLPRWFLLPLARLGGRIAARLNRRKLDRLVENCRHILGPGTPEPVVARTARESFIHIATSYFDMLRLPVLRHRAVRMGEIDAESLGNLDRALAPGRGAILVTAHIGNWDFAGAFLTALGYPLSAVVEPIPAGWTRTFNRYRSATDMETIPIPERRTMKRAIERRRVLTLVADRDLTGRGVLCPAFDARRAFPRGPAAYSLKYRLPVVVGHFVHQRGPGRPPYVGRIGPALEFSPTGSTDDDIVRFTRIIAGELNRIIARHPDQWLVFRADWQ